MLTRRTVILAKNETSYGTDPVPTPAANAILVSDVAVKPTGEVVKRDFIKSSLSQLQFLRGQRQVEVSFKTELKGTGTKGVLPAYGWEGALFRACGMSETIAANTSIVYAPVSTGFESVALYVYKDGVFHKILGCRGSVKLTFEVGKHPMAEWKFKGLYISPTDTAPAAQTLSPVRPPIVMNAALSLGAYAAIAEKIEIDLNNTISERKSIGSATGIVGFEITGREPQGSLDPEAVTEATHPFWGNWESAAAVALVLGPIGTASGNIVQVNAPKMQYKEVTYGDRNGIVSYSVPFALAMNSGDDELTITIT